MSTVRLRFAHSTLETFGDHSLAGMIFTKSGVALNDVRELVLEFEQTSMSYRNKNKGPATVLMPEYAPVCLIGQVLRLVEQGIKVRVEQVAVERPT